jgi:hypothetical protein
MLRYIVSGLTGLILYGSPVDTNARNVIWNNPGTVETLDFVGGPGGREMTPAPPFVFNEEEHGGTSAKLLVTDANKRQWSVKFGPETKAEVFASRMLWAAGYPVEINYYVGSGGIDSVGALGRAEPFIDRSNGNRFTNARFELRDPKLYPVGKWNMLENPFKGTHELNGLKIMMMLVSNWDVKDARSSSGPNASIMDHKLEDGSRENLYLIDDWGASMGKWGDFFTREKWDHKGYAKQTSDFVDGVDRNGFVGFGFQGKRTTTLTHGVTIADVKWLMQYLGRITDQQIADGLRAAGASPEETDSFAKSVRSRIEQLRKIAGQ